MVVSCWLSNLFNGLKMNFENNQNKGIFNGVFLGYFVLVLHVLLILGLGITVVLIKGIYDFRWVIFTAGIILIIGSAYLFYLRLKASKRSLYEAMNDPALRDRTLEISLLGGMASLKLGHKGENAQLIEANSSEEIKQLEAPKPSQIKELGELVKMLENDLITRDEFQQLKETVVSENQQ